MYQTLVGAISLACLEFCMVIKKKSDNKPVMVPVFGSHDPLLVPLFFIFHIFQLYPPLSNKPNLVDMHSQYHKPPLLRQQFNLLLLRAKITNDVSFSSFVLTMLDFPILLICFNDTRLCSSHPMLRQRWYILLVLLCFDDARLCPFTHLFRVAQLRHC